MGQVYLDPVTGDKYILAPVYAEIDCILKVRLGKKALFRELGSGGKLLCVASQLSPNYSLVTHGELIQAGQKVGKVIPYYSPNHLYFCAHIISPSSKACVQVINSVNGFTSILISGGEWDGQYCYFPPRKALKIVHSGNPVEKFYECLPKLLQQPVPCQYLPVEKFSWLSPAERAWCGDVKTFTTKVIYNWLKQGSILKVVRYVK